MVVNGESFSCEDRCARDYWESWGAVDRIFRLRGNCKNQPETVSPKS